MTVTHRILLTLARLATLPVRLRLWAFERACRDPQPIQEQLLFNILHRQQTTNFGLNHKFNLIHDLADFRNAIPVTTYDYYEPYIRLMMVRWPQALVNDDHLLMFALTSGTTAARKLIPITQRYLNDYRRGWNMWGMKVLRDHRHRYNGLGFSIRPIVQMVGDPVEFRTPTGIPCGALSGFTAQVQKWLVKKLYTVPAILGQVKDARSRYYCALRLSLHRPCAMFLAANPSSLIQLARCLNDNSESLLKDFAEGTLSEDLELPGVVREALRPKLTKEPALARLLTRIASSRGRLYPQDVWEPESVLLGTWTGGSMGHYLKQLPTYFGPTLIRDLGLLASEGRFTIPLDDNTPSGVLDIWSHYFEFLPEALADKLDSPTLQVHELELGKNYFIIPTTAAGLYRYHISDLVRVTGFYGRTPMVEFLGKGSRISSLTGEKLSEYQVTQAVQELGFLQGTYSLAPIWDEQAPYYELFVEEDLPGDIGLQLDEKLGVLNVEYASKRQSGRLGPVRVKRLPDGYWAKWDRDRIARTGGSPEQYKHPALITKIEEAPTGV